MKTSSLFYLQLYKLHLLKCVRLFLIFLNTGTALGDHCQDNGPEHVLKHSSRIQSYDHVSVTGDVVSICANGCVYLWRKGTCIQSCALPSKNIMSFANQCPLYFCRFRAGLLVYNDDNYVYAARLEEDAGMTEEEKMEGVELESVVEAEGEEEMEVVEVKTEEKVVDDEVDNPVVEAENDEVEALEEKQETQETQEKASGNVVETHIELDSKEDSKEEEDEALTSNTSLPG